MPEINFKSNIETLLKTDKRLVDENKELNLTAIRDLADKLDEQLIQLLLNNKEAKEKFFLKIKDVLVFRHTDFKFFLDENKIDNSYTAYENKIGLSSNSRLLKESGEVVLNFPYKDCVLEGGQTTEEGTDEFFEYNNEEEKYELYEATRKEIFFNEVLAQDEIDRLEEPKAFTNIKKYIAKGEENLKEFARNKDGIITDNLLIKGNNLLALHCLKEEFYEQVKLIYIDPPYNRDADAFYNDKFKNSTWLTFMKNRLEVAKELLRDDGFIFIQIDDFQLAYLKILCDEVFSREKAVNIIAVKMSETSGLKMSHVDKKLPKIKEFLLVYKKNNASRLNPIKIKKETQGNKLDDYLKYYKKVIENIDEPVEKWKISSISDYLKKQGKKTDEESIKKFQLENAERVIYRTNNASFANLKVKGTLALVKSKQGLDYVWWEGKQMLFLSDYIDEYVCDLWTDISTINLNKEGGVDLQNGKKPEKLLKRIIELITKEGDLVMDYHLGSGTTASVALKLNRKFIGIEQLDYGSNDSLVRLKGVVKGDISGISEEINWKGGGSFVYLELAKWNEEAKEKIYECKSLKELKSLFKELCEKYFLHYNVRVKDFIEGNKDKKISAIVDEENFIKLPLPKQKEMFAKMLDLNQLYVNVSEMEDKKFGLSKEDIVLTKNFYNQK
ncbi:MAG: site-specific DNA-methyltransferase [Thermoplasmata archaeon]